MADSLLSHARARFELPLKPRLVRGRDCRLPASARAPSSPGIEDGRLPAIARAPSTPIELFEVKTREQGEDGRLPAIARAPSTPIEL